MKRFLSILLSFAMFTGSMCSAAIEPQHEEFSDEKVTFIIEVEGDPAMVQEATKPNTDLGSATEEILSNQSKVMSSIKKEVSSNAEQGFVYTALFNGFSLDGTRDRLDELKAIDGVKNVYIASKIPVPKPQLESAGEIADISTAYTSGYSGKGQAIAIIDDYLDTNHEFFQTAPEEPKYTKKDINKILQTKALNSKAVSANQVYKNAKIPYAFDYVSGTADTYSDESYHGTHVSGIAAGKNGTLPTGKKFNGIAYDAQILFLNACDGEYFRSQYILAAINDAALLGADVINMSFGSTYTDSASEILYKTNIDNARKCGISIAAAAGNSSRGFYEETPLTANPDYSAEGTPASFGSLTSVASAQNTKIMTNYWNVELKGHDGNLIFFDPYGESDFPSVISDYAEYVYCGYGRSSEFEGKDLTGKIALIDRGVTLFTDMVKFASAAGAVGIILSNTDETAAETSVMDLPMACVYHSTGELLKNAEEKKIKHVSTNFGVLDQADGGKLSDYTSWGVDSTLQLKPEITAPGGNIYSSYPSDGYVYLSGTSMASPFIAGVFAIAKQRYKTNPYKSEYNGLTGANLTDIIENVMMNTADIIRDDDGMAYSPRLQGAGLVNVQKMLNGKVMITSDSGKAKVSLGEIKNNSFDLSFKVTNISNDTVKFDKISVELMTDGYYAEDGKNYVDNTIAIEAEEISMPSEITLDAGETYNFKATIKLKQEFINENMKIFTNGFFVDGYAVLDSTADVTPAVVPFTGFYGDWYDLPVFDSTSYDEGGSALITEGYPYNSGTFLQAYINNSSYYYVGRNPLNKAIADKKYISFSNTSGLTLALSYRTYRGLSKTRFSIEDKDGTVKYDETLDSFMEKFYLNTYKFDNTMMSALSEGEYVMKVEATANGNDKVNDTLTLPLVIDNTPPEFVSAKYDAETHRLTFSMKDNHYLSCFDIEYDTDGYSSFALTEDYIRDGITTISLDLSKVQDINSVVLTAYDYAMNYTRTTIDVLTDKIGAEPVKLLRLNGMTSVSFNLRNNTGADVKADTSVAFYDEQQRLIATSVIKNYTITKGSDNDLTFSMLQDTRKADFVKLFIWQPGSMEPIDTAKTFTIVN